MDRRGFLTAGLAWVALPAWARTEQWWARFSFLQGIEDEARLVAEVERLRGRPGVLACVLLRAGGRWLMVEQWAASAPVEPGRPTDVYTFSEGVLIGNATIETAAEARGAVHVVRRVQGRSTSGLRRRQRALVEQARGSEALVFQAFEQPNTHQDATPRTQPAADPCVFRYEVWPSPEALARFEASAMVQRLQRGLTEKSWKGARLV